MMFLMPNTAVVGPGDPVVLPRQSDEIALRGGARRRDRPDLQGRAGRAAPTTSSSATPAPTTSPPATLQRTDGQWARAKGFDTFCPLGPWIETDLDPADLAHRSRACDGETVQDGRPPGHGASACATLVAYASAAFTLLPGDVILTGTPAGVGPIAERPARRGRDRGHRHPLQHLPPLGRNPNPSPNPRTGRAARAAARPVPVCPPVPACAFDGGWARHGLVRA